MENPTDVVLHIADCLRNGLVDFLEVEVGEVIVDEVVGGEGGLQGGVGEGVGESDGDASRVERNGDCLLLDEAGDGLVGVGHAGCDKLCRWRCIYRAGREGGYNWWLSMAEAKAMAPECVYGKPCYAVCVNPQCRKPGIICELGYHSKNECNLLHEACPKMKWSELEGLIYDNPNLRSPEFYYLRDKMDGMFVTLLNKIKAEHSKFKLWVKTYGYSIEVMKFIKNLTEYNFTQINGNYMSPIVREMTEVKKVETPKILEADIAALEEDIAALAESVGDLYLKPGVKRERGLSAATSISQSRPASILSSRILSDVAPLTRFFDSKIASMRLLFRASENAFSIREFHKKCDGEAGTLVLAETEFGKIIGGYTPVAWSSAKKQWAADKSLKSFIFSVNMREKFNLNLAQFAIANNPDKGPIFGCCDICIVDNGNKERSNAEFPISYNNGKYIRSPESSFAFTGHPKGQFLVKEWEVFKIDFE